MLAALVQFSLLYALSILHSGSAQNATHNRQLFTWGNSFGTIGNGQNVKYACEFNGKPICCGLLSSGNQSSSEEAHAVHHRAAGGKAQICTVEKKYVPSNYESTHFAKAEEIAQLSTVAARRAALVSFISSDIPACNVWLGRVHAHMVSEGVPNSTPEDEEYLSKFIVTKTCTNAHAHLSSSWIEWIEPLTVHARHPFGYEKCSIYTDADKKNMKFSASKQSRDYVLLKAGHNIQQATAMSAHNPSNSSSSEMMRHHNHHPTHSQEHLQTRNFFLDAGASTFENSMMWFLCAYLQRNIAFDQEYGFEYTLLEPQDFWKRVPPNVKPTYHFFNAPVTAGVTDDVSPLRFIQRIATPEDFVAFKLDIDTPSIEVPLALEVLSNPQIASLVDEFFFELHFLCEIMSECGWGSKMPHEDHGLVLDRLHAMKFFRDLRVKGIRSHFWP